MFHNVRTLADVKRVLDSMTAPQLAQPAQIVPPATDVNEVRPLHTLTGIGTISLMEAKTRSTYNNEHNPGDIVFYSDFNPFPDNPNVLPISGYDEVTRERFKKFATREMAGDLADLMQDMLDYLEDIPEWSEPNVDNDKYSLFVNARELLGQVHRLPRTGK